jgi:Tfp pilus assembly protein PilO
MKELISLLDVRERRIMAVLCLLLAASVLFLAFVLVKERGTARRTLKNLQNEKMNYKKLDTERNDARRDFQRWQDGLRDMEELKTSYFYDEKSASQGLRLDLQQIFRAAGVNWSQIKYDYSDFTAEGIKKVDVSFVFSGSYEALKKFLEIVEKHPKFLFVERISFTTINPQAGELEAKINLAGYYER